MFYCAYPCVYVFKIILGEPNAMGMTGSDLAPTEAQPTTDDLRTRVRTHAHHEGDHSDGHYTGPTREALVC